MILNGNRVDIHDAVYRLGLERGSIRNNNLVTRCPWPEGHSTYDKHPSFCINMDTGAWICYTGCGKGSILTLVHRMLGVERNDAKSWLLSNARRDVTHADVLASLPPLQDAIIEPDVGAIKAAQEDYNAMDPSRTSSYLLDRGYNLQTIVNWGLRYDVRYPAVVIPIKSIDREIVATIRRMVPPVPPGTPKYLYSKGFDRSNHLFGANRHTGGNTIIVVEGPLDAIWLHQNGYTTAVALLGAYCSSAQVVLLRQLGSQVTLALDNDDAGKYATERLQSILSKDFAVSVVPEYDGKDVQELDEYGLRDIFTNSRMIWETIVRK